jgi:hypothetical protein
MGVTGPLAYLLAHQGGWDEMLFVLVPISLFAGLLSLANKRAIQDQAERQAEEERDSPAEPAEPAEPGEPADQPDGD